MSHRTWLALAVPACAAIGLAWPAAASQDPPAKDGKDPVPIKPSTDRKLCLPETPDHYADPALPSHFKTATAEAFDNTPADNPVTDAGATLGRVLFYDTRLSANNTVACASCHHQNRAFAGPERFVKGFDGKRVDRHPMGLGNARYYPRGRFFWDERAPSLEDQVLTPIQSKVEMGQDLKKLTDNLARDEHYPELFRKAFGTPEVTPRRLARALAQFVRSLVSYRSKYDEGLARVGSVRDDFPNFSAEENRGKTLFLGRCATCHLPGGQAAHFFMNRPLNNGLDLDFKNADGGVGDLTLNGSQFGLFKSPSLRNVEFTGPYMHDGRFDSLEAVIDHYSTGVKQHPNLDPRLRLPLNLTKGQKAALVAFLRTLSDPHFITDAKFSDPFQ
jgi:cytochrome c peroxidase